MWFSMNPGLEVDLEFQPTRKYTVIISQIQGKQLHFTFDRETWNITSIFCLRKIYKKISEMKRNQRFGSSKVGSRLATQKVVQHQPISSLRSPSTPNSDYQGLFGHFLGVHFFGHLSLEACFGLMFSKSFQWKPHKTPFRTSIFIGWYACSFNNIRTKSSFAPTKYSKAAN